ncbi:ABC-type nitrate/sulfonate/bicarbonate transport system ATPase subunit [Aminobacter lissarensis]|uniref:ABC-type nitrate/sulfonate/bicarbonate transport system ATPase subunit n=1 Tax=Aminobacter carboxidus TaxID=376165 RepID=A0A8E2BFS2_9HYPH|nr:ABC transporter ATP-binding protein [Aminobacter lissarensis]MBB6469839.1 ABC-type nitrate/sulfonate/bicarbonate transport system ATPase subunit [Aminobacter lissarensis]
MLDHDNLARCALRRSEAPVAKQTTYPSLQFIAINSVGKTFAARTGSSISVLDCVDLTIAENEFVSFVGRSGCGKTTLLNIIAGLEEATQGQISIAGRPVTGPGQGQGVVFQQHALFPWLTAVGNVAFGFRKSSLNKTDRRQKAMDLLTLVGLEAAASKYPREMSGGMQQRVSIARALALDPQILLMDEPFGALDELTRIELQHELLRIWEAQRKTVVFVTHSINEALMLSDRIVLLAPNPGRIKRVFDVDLPRPRSRTEPRFNALYEEIWDELST